MKHKGKIFLVSLLLLLTAVIFAFTVNNTPLDDRILAYTVDTKKQNLQFYWKNDSGKLSWNIKT